ncbi:hypothetical protein IFM89_012658 [Coptis chinensis]|uniref:C2 domain-containing protein n=1 Tax=Coptis chinensis TaxID=261450 RepID=A0A835LHQ8_9MAGN|nr:hypothetical protein IFM89_012658 [Coptis chinensis]
MKLLLRVIQGRNLRAMDLNGSSDPQDGSISRSHAIQQRCIKAVSGQDGTPSMLSSWARNLTTPRPSVVTTENAGKPSFERFTLSENNPLNMTEGWLLPTALQNSAQLLNLTLSGCGLVGAIPDFLGTMSSLSVLQLADNRLSGGIPASFKQSQLQILWLNDQIGNGLFGPIDVITSMTSVSLLWLHGNQFTGTIPVGIGALPFLTVLNLNSNRLVGQIPESLNKMTLLKKLDLSNNNLMGAVPNLFGSWLGIACNSVQKVLILYLPDNKLNGTSNGIVCLDRRNIVLLLNPTTREFKVVRFGEEFDFDCHQNSGFGYDGANDDYVLVKFINGEVLLDVSLSKNNSFLGDTLFSNDDHASHMESNEDLTSESSSVQSLNSPSRLSFSATSKSSSAMEMEEKPSPNIFPRLIQIFLKNGETACSTSKSVTASETKISDSEVHENSFEDQPSNQSSYGSFGEFIRTLEMRDQGGEIPSNLPGVLLDRSYVVAPSDLNSLLFSPDSSFTKSLAELQGTTELQEGPWTFENGGTVLVSVSTPDIIYGNTFKVELLYCIAPGPEVPTGEQSSRLVISWRMNFLQTTMMKGMIEGGVRQGLKGNFEQFEDLLSDNVKPVDMKEFGSNKEQVLASLQLEPQSDWKLATQYLLNFTVVSTILVGLYVLIHILLAMPSMIQGLEFDGLDLPDSIGEVVVCGILVLQGERDLGMIIRFMQARNQKGTTDHGVKAQRDGWLLTVALIEGSSLAAVDATGFSDPYVVFTCNGKTRTSSIKFQKAGPQWNEIFEFDAMDDPPSVLEIEVFDFDGPFDEAITLGHAEVNFLKSNLSDLADIWIPLQGKLAQACRSKLHLRIFLNNTRGNNVVKEYLAKMEKEVAQVAIAGGSSSVQLVTDLMVHFVMAGYVLLPYPFTVDSLQGRLFLSARIMGFHTNMFGNITKIFFLWEDIEDIQVLPPTLASMGSPSIIIILRPGREDKYATSRRTILALWKAISLTPEQKVQIVEEESEEKRVQTEESGAFLGLEDATMSEVYSSHLSIPVTSLSFAMCMSSVGGFIRASSYSLDTDLLPLQISSYGGEVTSTQQKYPSSNNNGWVVEEVMTLNGVPLADHFTLQIRYQVEHLPSRPKSCNVQAYFGITWLKSTRHQKRVTKNIQSNLTVRLKSISRST